MIRDLLAIALPTITVLVGILLNRNDSNRLESRINGLESRLDKRIDGLEGKIGSMENRFHSDFMTMIGKLTELEVRVSKLEMEQR